jgi:hypothetical protein
MLELYDRWRGIIPIVGGIYGLLLAYRVLPRRPKDPDRMELWHRKFGKTMKVLCPLLIVFGSLTLLGIAN